MGTVKLSTTKRNKIRSNHKENTMGLILKDMYTFDTPMNAVDAALDCGALFEAHLHPIVLPDGTHDENAYLVYRELPDGTQALLNPNVRKNYCTTAYTSLVQTAEALFPNSCIGMKLYGNGELFTFTQRLGEEQTWGDGDSIVSHVLWVGSLGSTHMTRAAGFAGRPFCTNQLPYATHAIKAKRTKNHDDRVFAQSTVMAATEKAFREYVARADQLKRMPLTAMLRATLLNKLAPIPTDEDTNPKALAAAEKRREGIEYYLKEEAEAFGHTGWAMVQAIHSYEFHVRTAGHGKFQEENQVNLVTDPLKGQPLTVQAERMLLASV